MTTHKDDSAVTQAKDVDDQIAECLMAQPRRSFFLYAGAGSGKTRSLVKALDRLSNEQGRQFWLRGQHVGVITYTNAACDEIKRRLDYDTMIDVSTIHSFAWSLIGAYTSDIRTWLRRNLADDIIEIEAAQAKGRPSKASDERARKIASKKRRLIDIETVTKFVYSPTGDNTTHDSLNHSEVVSMTSDLLNQKATLRQMLLTKYPILFIDESQDTSARLMDAVLAVQSNNPGDFCLGLFGDMMQRIYADGKADLVSSIPPDWACPEKLTNYRCPSRVINLINRIRSVVDDHMQTATNGAINGIVRLFIVPRSTPDKIAAETAISNKMASITKDERWRKSNDGYKALILEHHMAAHRLGFTELFGCVYAVDEFRTGLMDGTLLPLTLFANDVLPVVTALRRGDHFAVAAIVRSKSPLCDATTLRAAPDMQQQMLRKAKEACDSLASLWDGGATPTFGAVLRNIAGTGLFRIPDELQSFVAPDSGQYPEIALPPPEEGQSPLAPWDGLMSLSFDQVEPYSLYIAGKSGFDTHQGVKGLEFPRVMVIIDDEESRGFMFKYDKLFGVAGKSKTDEENERTGKETTVDRTRRLFYVTCSRAEESLAIVAYTDDTHKLKALVIDKGWFTEDEIEVIS